MGETLPEAHAEMAHVLSGLTGTEVTPVFGGFRLKETETHYIDVMRMLVNWRVTTTYKDTPYEYDRHWCFAGRDAIALPIAYVQAQCAVLAHSALLALEAKKRCQ